MAVVLVGCGAASEKPLSVTAARAPASPPGVGVGAAYFTIESQQADRVLSAHSPVAERVEIHESVATDGMMSMRHVETLSLAAGQPQVLAPGGMHVMLMGLRAPLVAGDTFALTLQLERAGEVTIDVQVVAPDALATH
jgi:copper(I)-binding protein